jgi:hypothetical protein
MYKLDLERLAKVLGMLGSAFDGEVIQAARTATEMVRRAETTWQHVLRPVPVRPVYNIFDTWHPAPEDDHRPVAEEILRLHAANRVFLYEREPDFLAGLRHWDRELTTPQQNWFDKIVLRARRFGCEV